MLLLVIIGAIVVSVHGIPVDTQTENNPNVVPGVFISTETLRNLQAQAQANNNQNVVNPNEAPIEVNNQQQTNIVNQQTPIVNQQGLIANQQNPITNQQASIMNQQTPITNQQGSIVNQQTPNLNQLPIYNQQQNVLSQQVLPNSNSVQTGLTQQVIPANQQLGQYLINQRNQAQVIPVNQGQYLVNQPNQGQFIPVNQGQYLVNPPNQAQVIPLSQGQYLVNQPHQGQIIPTNQGQYLVNQPSQALLVNQLIPGNNQLGNPQLYPNQQQFVVQQQNGQLAASNMIQTPGQTTLVLSPINNGGQILSAKPISLAPVNQNQGSAMIAVPANNVGGTSYLVPLQVQPNQVLSFNQ